MPTGTAVPSIRSALAMACEDTSSAQRVPAMTQAVRSTRLPPATARSGRNASSASADGAARRRSLGDAKQVAPEAVRRIEASLEVLQPREMAAEVGARPVRTEIRV